MDYEAIVLWIAQELREMEEEASRRMSKRNQGADFGTETPEAPDGRTGGSSQCNQVQVLRSLLHKTLRREAAEDMPQHQEGKA
jgi:hypothetical protein